MSGTGGVSGIGPPPITGLEAEDVEEYVRARGKLIFPLVLRFDGFLSNEGLGSGGRVFSLSSGTSLAVETELLRLSLDLVG